MIFSQKMLQNRNFSSTEIQKFRFRYKKCFDAENVEHFIDRLDAACRLRHLAEWHVYYNAVLDSLPPLADRREDILAQFDDIIDEVEEKFEKYFGY